MKKGFLVLFLLLIFNVLILNVSAVDDLFTEANILCDKTSLKVGESTNCFININTNGYLTQYQGSINISNGLKIDNFVSLNNNFSLKAESGKIIINSVYPSKVNNLNLVQCKITRLENVSENNLQIALKSEKSCYDTTLLGDVNGDGKVTVEDSELILKYYSGSITPNENEKARADVNKDGKVDSDDSILVLQIIDYINGNQSNDKFVEGRGDVNGDDNVDSEDAVLILQYYSGSKQKEDLTCDDDNCSNADVNNDGEINSEDAVLILQYYAHKIEPTSSEFNVCSESNLTGSDIHFNNDVENVNAPDTGKMPKIILYSIAFLLVIGGAILIIKSLKKDEI